MTSFTLSTSLFIQDIDENQKTALLLQNMLQRIGQLEFQLQNVIINSTKMVYDIKILNHTIMSSLANSCKSLCFHVLKQNI